MITCDFFLKGEHSLFYRVKTITEKSSLDCWKTFNKNFGEAISELVKVKVIHANGNEDHFHPIEFKKTIGVQS